MEQLFLFNQHLNILIDSATNENSDFQMIIQRVNK